MAELHGWNVAAGSNNSASPNGFPAGMLPSGVHPSAREVMAVLARYDKDNDGSLTTGGTTTAYTVTLNSQHSAWFTGLRFRVKFNATCGATPTINPTGSTALGAKSLYFPDGTQVTTGYLVSGGMYDCVYDGTNVQVVSVSSVPTGVIVTTRGDLLTRGASALSRLAIGTANTVLKTDGTDPSWGKVAGTMIRMGSDAQGDVYYFNGTDVARLGAGTSGQFLKTNGAGANPAWAYAGKVLQRVVATDATLITSSSTTPAFDDSLPQNTEGAQLFSQSFTPLSASSTILVRCLVNISGSTGSVYALSVFVDSGADAVSTGTATNIGTGAMGQVAVEYNVAAGSTTARTYAIRVGGTAAWAVNGQQSAAARRFGGSSIAKLEIIEIGA